MNQKFLTLICLILMLLTGCDTNSANYANNTNLTPPSKEELNAAFIRAIKTLNEKTNSQVEEIAFDWMEVPENCYAHLDYFAQQVLWATIYHKEIIDAKKRMNIDCSAAYFYAK